MEPSLITSGKRLIERSHLWSALNVENDQTNVIGVRRRPFLPQLPEEVEHKEVQDYRTDNEIRKCTGKSVFREGTSAMHLRRRTVLEIPL
jgi:hypothetical protein